MLLRVERVRVNTGVSHRSFFMKASNRSPDLSTAHDSGLECGVKTDALKDRPARSPSRDR